MNYKIKLLGFLLLTIMLSCSKSLDKKLMKYWSVTKMEKMKKVTSNSYSPVNIDINPNMSYYFMADNKVKLITQIGTEMNGIWSVNDSIISIKVKEETKQFEISELTDNDMVIESGDFKFYLESR